MRLFLLLLLTFFVVGRQSQPPSPTPVKPAHTNQSKAEGKKDKTSDNDETTKQLTSAINQLTSEVATRNQQQASAPHEDKSSAEWWSIGNAVLVTIFTAALAVLAYLQWKAMHRQADIADKQTQIADKQADIAAEQLAITKAAEALHKEETFAEVTEGLRERRRADERYSEQLGLARDNAATAKQSADAAKQSVDSLTLAERAWVLVTLELYENNPNRGLYVVCLTNRGRTPARIVEATGELREIEESQPLTEWPNTNILPAVKLLAPQEKWDIYTFGLDANFAGLTSPQAREGKKELFFGHIAYKLLFDTESDPLRYTRFCYRFQVNKRWQVTGPGPYNQYT